MAQEVEGAVEVVEAHPRVTMEKTMTKAILDRIRTEIPQRLRISLWLLP
jgi:hypothetical protein